MGKVRLTKEVLQKGILRETEEQKNGGLVVRCATFSYPEPTILLACGRNRELWEQPF